MNCLLCVIICVNSLWFCVNICVNTGLLAADLGPNGCLASSFACTLDPVRRGFRPMRRDLADSASTFADVETNH
jgi:hypothetical protein